MGKPCKICASETELWEDKQFQIDYYYCRDCHFLFMNEAHIVAPEEEKQVYEQHNNTLDNQGYVDMLNAFIDRAVSPYHKNAKTALDFGCGPGPVLAVLLRERGFEVDLYDVYFYPEKVYQDRMYDVITATEVFEHLKDPIGTTRELCYHLNDGGIMALMTLFHPGDKAGFNDWWYRRDPTHLSFYRPTTFRVIADLMGLELLDHDWKNTLVLRKKQKCAQ